jgi:Sulfotransferase family
MRRPRPRPILVLGSPRSGTTLIGKYLSSSSDVCGLGEYLGFYFSHVVADREFDRMPSPFGPRYLKELRRFTDRFARRLAAERSCGFYCDDTPWNLLVGDQLAALLPDAVFVLLLRHYTGVLQSLERSHAAGYRWAGGTWPERAALWSRFYTMAPLLPDDRMIGVSYDRLCAAPRPTLAALDRALDRIGIDTRRLQRSVFAVSHATGSSPRPTLGLLGGDRRGSLAPLPSWDALGWTGKVQAAVGPVVAPVDEALRARFGPAYVPPVGFPETAATGMAPMPGR